MQNAPAAPATDEDSAKTPANNPNPDAKVTDSGKEPSSPPNEADASVAESLGEAKLDEFMQWSAEHVDSPLSWRPLPVYARPELEKLLLDPSIAPEEPQPLDLPEMKDCPPMPNPPAPLKPQPRGRRVEEPEIESPAPPPPREIIDLEVTKQVDASEVFVGDLVTWVISVTNNPENANTPATGVMLGDVLPAGTVFVSAEVSQGSFDPDTGIWNIGSIPEGATVYLTLVTRVTENGEIVNPAEIIAADQPDFDSEPDPTPDSDAPVQDDEAVAVVFVQPLANVSIDKSVNVEAPNLGDEVIWTLVVTNDGPSTATNVAVADALPPGTQFVSADGDYNEATGQWIIGNLAPGEIATLNITTVVTDVDVITNFAAVTTDTAESDLEDNSDDASTDPVAADLAVDKSVNVEAPNLGDQVIWTIIVTNEGPDTAINASVSDVLPDGLSFVSASATAGSYDETAGTWQIGDLANGASVTLEIVTTVDTTEAITNIATVTSDTPDEDPTNNTDEDTTDPVAADLAVEKWVDDNAPNLGDEVAWTIVVTNEGPDTAINASVSDVLPDGLSFVSANATAGSYDETTGTWQIGDLANGASVTLEIVTTVETTDGITNIATVTSDTPDEDPSDNTDEDTTDPVAADLAVDKSVSNDAPNLGDEVTWTIVVTNEGPDTAVNASVSDVLPHGLTFVSASASVGSYDETTGVWQIGNLANGASVALEIVTTVETTDGITNLATVTSDTPDEDPNDNTDEETTDPVAADLIVDKSVSDDAPNLGDEVTWTIVVTNEGPDTAINASVSDVLPDGLSFVSANATAGSYDETTGTWQIGNLANGASVTLEIITTVETTEAITNIATVTSDTPDEDPSDNTDQDTTDPVAADLAVEKWVDDNAPNLGDEVAWTIVVTNEGPDTAINASVSDVLPDGLSFVSANATAGSYDETTGIWQIGDLANGASVTLEIVTTVETTEAITNIATVTSETPDEDPTNNTDEDTTDPVAADLAVDKSVNVEAPNLGDEVTWTIVVTNEGPDTAVDAKVSDLLPAGLSFVSASATAGSYDETTGVWQIGDLANGASVTLEILTTVETTEAITNIATVTSETPDEDPTNNTDEDTTDPVAADLAVDKSVNVEAPNLGDEITWTIVVTNEGPDTAVDAKVSDLLPAGLSFVSASASVGSYDETTGTWQIGDLANGASVTLEIVTTVETTDGITNIATVTSETPDEDPTNNTDEDTTDPVAADLAVDKSVNVEAPNLGDEVTWTIVVTNEGPDAAVDAKVSDLLPAGLSFVSASATAGSYDETTGTWQIGDLANGASVTLEIVTTVETTEAITNIATVTSETPDEDPSDNTDQDTTDPVAADLAVDKSVSDDAPNLGDEVIWTIVVTNNGPDTAVNSVLTDVLPSGVTHVSDSASVGSYDESTGEWVIGDLASGASATLTVTTTVDTTAAITNIARVTTDTPDTDPTNNEDDASTDPNTIDLSLTKTVDNPAPDVGEKVTWTIVLTNAANFDDASGVVVGDVIPAGTTFVSANPSVGSFNDATGEWTVGDLASGSSATLTITTQVNTPDPDHQHRPGHRRQRAGSGLHAEQQRRSGGRPGFGNHRSERDRFEPDQDGGRSRAGCGRPRHLDDHRRERRGVRRCHWGCGRRRASGRHDVRFGKRKRGLLRRKHRCLDGR